MGVAGVGVGGEVGGDFGSDCWDVILGESKIGERLEVGL